MTSAWITFWLILITGVFFLGLTSLVTLYDRFQCNRIGTTSQIETRFDFWTDKCFVKIGNQFIPYERWRVLDE